MKLANFVTSLIVLLASLGIVAAAWPNDWLINPIPFKARVSVSKDGREVELNNGLVRRVIRLQPNAATVALDNLVSGESLLRGVKPEAVVEVDFAMPAATNGAASPPIRVSVHYEFYDGLPCYCKWITVSNGTDKVVRVDRFSSELLAVVERASEVDELSDGRTPPGMHVETDMAFGGSMASGANRRSFRWRPDPDFHTQVNYEKQTPCLLDIGPVLGPAQDVAAGGTFESFRAWVLPFDRTDRERCGLAMRRMYRVIAPWTTENPLMMHLVSSNERAVTNAIDQCAAVGFEMLILSFGSGFDLENEKPATLEREQQVIHTRQNIYDGTWQKLPNMGWMFVPLTDSARIREKDGSSKRLKLGRDYSLELPVQVPAQGMNWFVIE